MRLAGRQPRKPALHRQPDSNGGREPGRRVEAESVAGGEPYSLRHRQGPWKDALLRRFLASADVGAVLAAALAAGAVNDEAFVTTLWAAAVMPLWIVSAKLHGLYDQDQASIRHLTVDELPSLFRWATVSAAVTTLILALGPSPLSPAAAVLMWGVALSVAVILRSCARFAWRRLVPAERGLVIGEGQLAEAVARKLVLEPGHHLALVTALPPASAGAGEAGTLSELEDTVRSEGVERVVVAMPDLDEQTLSHIVATCRALSVKLSVAPPLRAMLGTAVRLNHLAELPLIEFKTWNPSRSTMFLKRASDAAFAVLGLAALIPLFVVVAVAVRLDSPGPVLFRQYRTGLRGAPFKLIKFRTMVRDAEERLDDLLRLEDLHEPMFKLRADPRVTRVGRFLRRTSIDELPQLINVLRGEMSLVGPRPEEVRLVERYAEELRFRLEMRPGITGPMQVHGRGELTFQERVAVEREYIENYSLRKDVKLVLQTAAAVVRRRGAY